MLPHADKVDPWEKGHVDKVDPWEKGHESLVHGNSGDAEGGDKLEEIVEESSNIEVWKYILNFNSRILTFKEGSSWVGDKKLLIEQGLSDIWRSK